MAATYYAKILLKIGSGYPGTVLELGEAGYDTSANKFWMGNGIGNAPTGITMDPSFNALYNLVLGLESSIGSSVTLSYVDGSLNNIRATYIPDSSLSNDFIWNAGYLEVSLGAVAGLDKYATNASVNLYAAKTDASIIELRNADLTFATNASVGLSLQPYATNASIGLADFAKNASLGLYATNASIGLAGFAKQTYVDSSLNAKVNQTLFDSSIAFQTNWNTTQEVSLNNRVKKTGDTMTGDLILSGTGAFIRRDNSTNRIALYGGTGESDGAYFQVTGSGYTASPGGRSAEFVIGELSDSKYTLFSYNGISTWTPRFTLTGSSGLVSINNDISIGGSLRVTNCSSIGDNLPYAQIDVSNGNKLVHKGNYYGQEFQYDQNLTTTTTTQVTPNYTTKCSITTPTSLPAGTYKITASYGMNKNVTNNDLLSRIQVDGTTLGDVHNHELSDGTTWLYASRSMAIVLTAGSHTINLQFSQEANGTLRMRDCYLEIIRVS